MSGNRLRVRETLCVVSAEEVVERLEDIRHLATDVRDDEVAHMEEDRLHYDVLHTIASGDMSAGKARALAALALSTIDLDFARWCA